MQVQKYMKNQEIVIISTVNTKKLQNGIKHYFDANSKDYKAIPGEESKLSLSVLKHKNVLWQNSDASIIDLGNRFRLLVNTGGAGCA